MYVPASFLIQSLRREVSPLLGDEGGEASARQGIEAALTLLDVRERGGAAFLRERFLRLGALLETLAALPGGEDWHAEIEALLVESRAAGAMAASDALDAHWKAVQARFEAVTAALVASSSLSTTARAELALALNAWEVADRRSLTSGTAQQAGGVDMALTVPRVEAYLRDRFAEPSMTVTELRQISGGFGKETFLLKVKGEALDGEFIIRRDPIVATVDNDCHLVKREYPVIKAAFARGFPAPDALWVDTDHPTLPGGDFMVMRRAGGVTGGNVFGATEALSDDLVEVLAVAMARLHTLPPCTELGDLTSAIRADSWGLTIQEATRRYIQDWFDIYLRESHSPSPTLVALYGWLLDNVPDAEGAPVLLHADIGFHNMLIENGRLTALVDWEFAHVGDPAEDFGMAKNSSSNYDWDSFTRYYRAAGGPEISPERLHFFRIWHHVRNASASNLTMGKFADGDLGDLKLAYTGHFHFPLFINAASQLLAAGPEGDVGGVEYASDTVSQ